MKRLLVILALTGSALGAQGPAATSAASSATPSTAGAPQAAGRPALDSAALDALTRQVAAELRCPVCQGESIQESPSELAQEMKGVVRDQLAAGRTPDEVKAYFVGRYGEWILLRPTTTGFNALLYWLPPIVLLAGIGIVFMIARRWVRANAAAAAGPSSTTDNG